MNSHMCLVMAALQREVLDLSFLTYLSLGGRGTHERHLLGKCSQEGL